MNNYSWLTDQQYDQLLEEVVSELSAKQILSYSEVNAVLREELNNEVLEKAEQRYPGARLNQLRNRLIGLFDTQTDAMDSQNLSQRLENLRDDLIEVFDEEAENILEDEPEVEEARKEVSDALLRTASRFEKHKETKPCNPEELAFPFLIEELEVGEPDRSKLEKQDYDDVERAMVLIEQGIEPVHYGLGPIPARDLLALGISSEVVKELRVRERVGIEAVTHYLNDIANQLK
ncbi:MAG: hypothetical protein ABEK59_07605 [Halobacteria archaeon]